MRTASEINGTISAKACDYVIGLWNDFEGKWYKWFFGMIFHSRLCHWKQ
jgi:hypothetical protein